MIHPDQEIVAIVRTLPLEIVDRGPTGVIRKRVMLMMFWPMGAMVTMSPGKGEPVLGSIG